MKYVTPEAELMLLMSEDVITTSGTQGGGVDVDGDYNGPKDEF